VASACDRWGDYLADHFHLNQPGHRKIADIVAAAVRDAAPMVGPHADGHAA
jgi:lysophospholipase L1-like esterase